MKRMDDRGSFTLRRRTFLIVGAVVLTAVVAAWVLLIAGVINNKPGKNAKGNGKGDGKTAKEQQLTEVTDGNVLVFRTTAIYNYDEEGKKYLYSKREYNENGLLTANTYYHTDGSESTKYIYSYDEEGRKTAGTAYDGSGIVTNQYSYGYNDADGTSITCERKYGDGGETIYTKVCDATGHLTMSKVETADGVTEHYYMESYSSDGQLQQITDDQMEYLYLYDAYNKKQRIECRYRGELTEEEVFLSERESETYRYLDGKRLLEEKKEYDERGNIIHHIFYDEEGNNEIDILNEYDEKGNPSKKIRYEYGSFQFWYEYEIIGAKSNCESVKTTEKDQNGNIIKTSEEEYTLGLYITKRVEYDEAGNETIQVYSEYDEYGNPVKVIERMSYGAESPIMEYEYIPLTIPEKFATEYDLREK